jgi:hypothetical protein
MTRAERVVEVIRLREQGLTQRAIAERLGLSRSYTGELCADPGGLKVRARKTSYRGTCVVCGNATDGSGGRAKAPRYCITHANQNPDWLAHLTKWPAELLIERIQEWERIYGEPPAIPDWSGYIAERNGDWERSRRYYDADGYWPSFMTIVERFGSWNAGIRAAGFATRAKHGGSGNEKRTRNQRAKAAA